MTLDVNPTQKTKPSGYTNQIYLLSQVGAHELHLLLLLHDEFCANNNQVILTSPALRHQIANYNQLILTAPALTIAAAAAINLLLVLSLLKTIDNSCFYPIHTSTVTAADPAKPSATPASTPIAPNSPKHTTTVT